MNTKRIHLISPILIVLVDQLTKLWALTYAQTTITCTQFLSFGVCFNRGITWGVGHDAGASAHNGLVILNILALCAVAWWAYQLNRQGKGFLAQLCVLAAGCSNIIDRFMHGGVVDFIVFTLGTYSWPAFNIADAVIVCAVGYIIVHEIRAP